MMSVGVVLVVKPTRNDLYSVLLNGVHESMFFGDASRPVSLHVKSMRLGFPNAFKRLCRNSLAEFLNAFHFLGVILLPVF